VLAPQAVARRRPYTFARRSSPAPARAGPPIRGLPALAAPARAADAPLNPVRGGPLSERAPFAEERLRRLAGTTALITPALRAVWEAALAAPLDVAPT
jgi:hypothetical protein